MPSHELYLLVGLLEKLTLQYSNCVSKIVQIIRKKYQPHLITHWDFK